MTSGASSPQGDQSSEDHVLHAHAKILAAAMQRMLPKQPTIAIGAQPIRVKVMPTDTRITSVVMVHDPVKDHLTFLTGQRSTTDPTTAHTVARLLHEQLGMCYGPDTVEHIVTSHVDKMGGRHAIFRSVASVKYFATTISNRPKRATLYRRGYIFARPSNKLARYRSDYA